MEQFQFVDPGYFLLLPLALLPLWRQGQAKSFTFSQTALVSASSRSWRLWLRPFLPWLQTVGMVFLLVALARPQTVQAEQVVFDTETAVIFALDISNSMKAQDLLPNRLAAAKEIIKTIVTQRPTTQFGLVLFANQAYIQLPPTYDHTLFLDTLDTVGLAENMGLPDGTSLGAGIATSAGLLSGLATEKRLIILFTDGKNRDENLDPILVSRATAQLDIQLEVVAMGKPGLVPFPQSQVGSNSNLVYWESPLDEAILQQLAEVGDGFYGRATDENLIRQISEQLLIATAVSQPPLILNQAQEHYHWPLILGLFLLFVCHSLRQTALRQLPEVAT